MATKSEMFLTSKLGTPGRRATRRLNDEAVARAKIPHASLAASPFAEMLREWRKKNNWYVKEAANTIGVPFETYRGWEAGRHMPSTLAKNAIRACMKAYPGCPF